MTTATHDPPPAVAALCDKVLARGTITNSESNLIGGANLRFPCCQAVFQALAEGRIELVGEGERLTADEAQDRRERARAADRQGWTDATIRGWTAFLVQQDRRRNLRARAAFVCRDATPAVAHAAPRLRQSQTQRRSHLSTGPPARDPDADPPHRQGRPARQYQKACVLIAAALEFGPQAAGKLRRLLADAGVSVRTERRARRDMNVRPVSGNRVTLRAEALLISGRTRTARLPWETPEDHADRHRRRVREAVEVAA